MEAYINSISYYLPERILSNDELIQEFPDWTVEKISSKVGINNRHISAENETAVDMAVKAATILFNEHCIERSSIDFILLCTQSPDYFIPTSSCIVQSQLGLPKTCGALDFNLGCSGFIYGLSLAKGLIISESAKNVLLITSETYSKHIHQLDKGNRTIFGDGAAATLISTEGFAKIGSFSFGTDGEGAENLIVKTGGFRNKSKINDFALDSLNNPNSSDHLFMDGSAIFNFTADVVPILFFEVLKKNKMDKDDINLFVFHQANKYMINYLRKLLEIDPDKFFIFIENVGNTVSSTIPIALYEAIKNNLLKGNVLLTGFGVGYSWGGVVINVKNIY